ncbi:MAG: dTDP-4-dehydrorhamnose 3,5-epimerase [Saprospiraceae bacterium]|jgi:dTDP-4-dehydrorhamnose 3,5-epimerase|nr:dTDP-4-dehydrorhamnose 3,5-epimerase [Saprospiraceae bacterium]MBP9209965.1 dTDP-4-dehydrorhamnose 3,5-epimerase [Saprospiraceae bacterium]MBV6473218.1 dTDP-4-dehydrorhamnose 3,5-epimerase [Saprospiraceae bacterium]
MDFTQTGIQGLILITPKVIADHRGNFTETFNQRLMEAYGLQYTFVQDNEVHSIFGVIRGLHYQKGSAAQTKLVRVIKGTILDVAVDLREGSPHYMRAFSTELSEANHRQLLIPAGFAHGYAVLSESAVVLYKVDNYYSQQDEAGIHPLDPALSINWLLPPSSRILSEKDLTWPYTSSH